MSHLMSSRETAFTLWRPARTVPAPKVRIISFVPGNPPSESLVFEGDLALTGDPDVWALPILGLPLVSGQVYEYWFIVVNDRPGSSHVPVRCTDPFARVIDYRLGSPPAGVIKLEGGRLVDCDPDGSVGVRANTQNPLRLSTNNSLVIYELPSTWARGTVERGRERDVGSFRDVLALLSVTEPGGNFSDTPEVADRAHLLELGVNAVELLPPADSPFKREWGYGTGNYFAADWDLGFPEGNATPSAEVDLRKLVARMHELDIRFFPDIVMAFGHTSYRELNFDEFHIEPTAERDNPDAYQSSRVGELRDGFGGSSWRYARSSESYDPVTGGRRTLVPARQFLLAHLLRWMRELGVDGIRLDSVNNIANWDFVREFTQAARSEWHKLSPALAAGDADARFLVIGEELAVPLDLIRQGRLDSLWNEHFQSRVRAVIRGRAREGTSFEQTVREMVDCRELGFNDGAQAVNYVTSHDVEGFEKERLFDFLQNNDIAFKEERVKLAFVCLLTAVGIPMILAGEEFVDQHDRGLSHPDKQQDPVNFERLSDPWRRRVFDYTARLVSLRKSAAALAVNDTNFIHFDLSSGRRICAWVRGDPAKHAPVVVVANFSGIQPPGSEYRVPNWPATPSGKRWREITQNREVPSSWIGREPLFPWEAKVYTYE
jgi:pullulanase